MTGKSLFATAAVMALMATLARAETLAEEPILVEIDEPDLIGGLDGEDIAYDDGGYDDPGIWIEDDAVADGGDWIDGGDATDGSTWKDDPEMVADMPTFDPDDCGVTCEMAVTGAGAPASARQTDERAWEELHKAGQRNVCFEADLYVPLLCDWQRPFLGDRMP